MKDKVSCFIQTNTYIVNVQYIYITMNLSKNCRTRIVTDFMHNEQSGVFICKHMHENLNAY